MTPIERVSLQAVGDLLILALLELSLFILFTGIFVGLWILASLSLLNRGLGKSRARWAQFIALLMTFLAGIGPSVTIVANFAIAAGTLNLELATTGNSALYSVGRDWTLQINLLVNDVVVTWRAWTLYSDNAIVMSSLCFMFCATVATTFASLVLVTQVLEFPEAANVLSTEALANILNTTTTALSLATNIFATSLIFFQFWRERRFNDRSGLHRSSLTSSQRIMLLLVEAGFIFCLAEVAGLCFGIYNARNRTIPAMTRIVLVGIDTMLWAVLVTFLDFMDHIFNPTYGV